MTWLDARQLQVGGLMYSRSHSDGVVQKNMAQASGCFIRKLWAANCPGQKCEGPIRSNVSESLESGGHGLWNLTYEDYCGFPNPNHESGGPTFQLSKRAVITGFNYDTYPRVSGYTLPLCTIVTRQFAFSYRILGMCGGCKDHGQSVSRVKSASQQGQGVL